MEVYENGDTAGKFYFGLFEENRTNDCNPSGRYQALATEKNLAVVMPSGDNSFYVDSVTANNDYGRFIGEELFHMTRRMFPLSHKLEDTFIAGFSMGGFGALRNGLKYYDTFGYIAALSSALNIFELPADMLDVTYEETDGMHNWAFWNSQIQKVLNWLPLEIGSLGLDSGNVV